MRTVLCLCFAVATGLVVRAATAQTPERPPEQAPPAQTPPTNPNPTPSPAPPATLPPPSEPLPSSPTPPVSPPPQGAPRGAAPPAEPASEAPAPALRDLEELDLAQLLNMKASVSSKKEESVSISPGMVTVYSQHDMRRLGYYTLSDLANITAGYSSYTIYGEKVFETRGQKAGSFNNNKHLVLIDGIPVNFGKGNKAMIDENYPLFFADRVEFLRGPASALYGTSAFFGAVNITSKQMDRDGLQVEGRGGLGTQEIDKHVHANMMYRDADRHAAIYVGFYDKGSSGAFVGTKDDPNNRFWDRQRSEFLYVTYGVDTGILQGLGVGFIYSSRNGGLGEGWNGGYSPLFEDLTWVQMIPYVKYARKLSRTLQLNSYFKASRDIERGTAANTTSAQSPGTGAIVGIYENRISVYEGLAELRWSPLDALDIIGGFNVNVNYQNTGDNDFGGSVQAGAGPLFTVNNNTLRSSDVFQTYSPYLQGTGLLPVLKGLHLTAGLRVDAGQAVFASFQQVSPRAGIVQELTDFLSLKVMYGTALRAPGNKEIGLNNESRPVLANPADAAAVRPEVFRTLEGGVSVHTEHVSVNAAVFANETVDALDGRQAPGADGNPRNIFANSKGKTVAQGTEVEVAVAATADARVFANYAYARAVLEPDQGPQTSVGDVPIHKVNGGASYRLRAPIDLTGTLVARYVSGYRVAPSVKQQPDGSFVVDSSIPEPAGSFLLDLNVIWRATEHLSFEVLGRNLLDTKYKLPKAGVPDVPMPGRSLLATLDYRW